MIMRRLQKFFSIIGRPFFYLIVGFFWFTFYLLNLFKLYRARIIFLGLISLVYFYYSIFYQLPSPKNLANGPRALTTQILDRNGKLLYKIYQEENRTIIETRDLPDFIKKAFIAIEDNDFYSHAGFSIPGIARAFIRNINIRCSISNIKCSLEGGSTITQQLVKNALLSPERTWKRKIKEIILAIGTEIIYDKETILKMYLNQVSFGGPAYGIEEASQQYFGLSAKDLSIPQAAFLAGLPKAPSKYSPYLDPTKALQRQHQVLSLMRKNNYLTEEEFKTSLNQKLNILPPKIGINAPHFVMYVRDILVDLYGENLVNKGGLKVTTTLDLNIQEYAQKAVVEELKRINSLKVTNGSVLVTKPETGEILAMIGSKNYFDLENDGQVNLTTSLRQPGSSIKPVNYALAIENGLSVNTILRDEPVTFNVIGTGLWSPKNYDGQFHGNVTLRNALANSYNIPAVLLLVRNGIKNMAELAKKMGVSTWNDESRYGLSLTLGSLETKMTDMAVVFGTFANKGVTVPLNPFIKIEDSQGKSLPIPKYSSHQSLKESTAFLISDILSDNAARSRTFGYNGVLNTSPHKVAVKTGTSNELKDNWTIGYTPEYLVATWVGNNDGSPMSYVASGITGASPIWSNVIKEIIKDHPVKGFDIPSNFIKVGICELTGELACENCPTKYEYFLKGTQPTKACSLTPTPSPTP